MKDWEAIERSMTLDHLNDQTIAVLQLVFDVMSAYEMVPIYEDKKSYYGKAKIIEHRDGSRTLKSYNTEILTYHPTGEFTKHWNGWSATTGRHINEFSLQMTGKTMYKKDYERLGK